MMQLAVFAIVLAVVFALNAIIAMRVRDDMVANSTSFSWMSARPEDAEAAARASQEPETIRTLAPTTPTRRAVQAGI